MTTIDQDALLRPREFPDGTVTLAGEAPIDRKLREGDPTLGWEGDPTLQLALNTLTGRWEVWRRSDLGGEAVRICSAPQKGGTLPGDELIRLLVNIDSRRTNVVEQIDQHNRALDDSRHAALREHIGAVADKLAWALGRDLGEPAQDGRLYSLGTDDAAH